MREALKEIPGHAWKNCKAYRLTDREIEVAFLLSTGQTDDGIAGSLAITRNTVRSHVDSIYGKLGVGAGNRRALAVGRLQRMGVTCGN